MKKLLITIALLAAAPAFSASCNIPGLPKITGLSYHSARAKLIEAGFFPALTPFPQDRAPWETEPRTLYGYHETIACSGTGFAVCEFGWKTKTAKVFSVYSHGEIDRVAYSIKCLSL